MMIKWGLDSFWADHLHWNINGSRIVPVYAGNSGSQVYRIHLNGAGGFPGTVILKETQPVNRRTILSLDKGTYLRESYVYPILREFNVPCSEVFLNIRDEKAQYSLIVMEDLAETHYFCESDHKWSMQEAKCILDTYVLLHNAGNIMATGQGNYPCIALPEHYWFSTVDPINVWQRLSKWPPTQPSYSQFRQLFMQVKEIYPKLLDLMNSITCSLSYNDFYPTNIAIPARMDRPAVLIDWQLVGWGSILNSFMNAFDSPSFDLVDRQQLKEQLAARTNFTNGTSLTMEQLQTVNRLLGYLYEVYITYRYSLQFPSEYQLPGHLQNAVANVSTYHAQVREWV